MEYLSKIFELWQFKLIAASVLMVFAPFKVSIWILLLFIILDTVTGCCNAIKIRKFSSKGLRKSIKKVLAYSTTIIVVRFLEVGISPVLETNMVTKLMIAFLILTEAVSILENLTLCGVPLPPGVLRLILGSLNFQKFYEIFGAGFDKQKYFTEIDEIINYQIPLIKSKCTRELLTIKLEEWKETINLIDDELTENVPNSSELLFYRMSSIIYLTNNATYDKWVEEGIAKNCIESFQKVHNQRVDNLINDIREVCYLSENNNTKKKTIIEMILVVLYQNVIDFQKVELLNEG